MGLFLLAFLPRALYPVSRPLQWYFRSAQFFQAILEGDWAGTLFSEHPGVTVMWLSGAALWGWEAGAVIEDPYEIQVPFDAPSGDYTLSVGMYDPSSPSLERLPAFAPDGEHLPEDRVALATVQVRPAVPWWRRALSGAWLAVIAAGIVLPQMRRRE